MNDSSEIAVSLKYQQFSIWKLQYKKPAEHAQAFQADSSKLRIAAQIRKPAVTIRQDSSIDR
jgi:hypothetical protein